MFLESSESTSPRLCGPRKFLAHPKRKRRGVLCPSKRVAEELFYMRIGFDLDKVFIDYPPIVPDKIIDRLYKKKANGTLLYRIPSRPEQILRRLSHLTFLRPPIYENISFLKSIPKDKNELYLISSRYKFLKKTTDELLKRHEFDKVFNAHYFNFDNKQPHLFKAQTLKKLKLDMYVDDDLHLLRHVAKENPQTTFFWLTPSVSTEKLSKNIRPVLRLSDILVKKL